jgi:2-polyprenyl-3-methyl-5-hydroxy-6-metoxy-1,4-benzoquinol methylase
MSQKIKHFYAGFANKLLSDYIGGNPRMLTAIRFALHTIPINATQILDIGCGIGWSSWEVKRHYTDASVLGVDISPALLRIANTLFCAPNLQFMVSDITAEGGLPSANFDAILLLDVYEHIPCQDRVVFHRMLRHLIKDQGVIILTCPSVFHQNFLRTYKPEGLQPVDEDVALTDMLQLAQDVDGEVLHFNYQTIWNTNDYTHTVIQKKPLYKQSAFKSHSKHVVNLEPERVRYQRAKNCLQVDIPEHHHHIAPVRLIHSTGRRIKHFISQVAKSGVAKVGTIYDRK